MKRLGLLLLAAVFTSGCAGLSKELEYNEANQKAFVYGYIDMKKAPCELGWLETKKVAPPTDKPYFSMRHDKGAFYNETIEPGSYQLSGLGGRGKGFLIFASNDIYKFTFPAQAEGIRASQAGKLYYIGSYKLMSKGDLFSQTYYIVPSKSPTPKEILEMILPHAKGNQWEPLIERRIKELSQ